MVSLVSQVTHGPASELRGVQVCVPSWIITTPAEAVCSCRRSESYKINSCHNKGCGRQITSEFAPEDTDFHVSVGKGFHFYADSNWGSVLLHRLSKWG